MWIYDTNRYSIIKPAFYYVFVELLHIHSLHSCSWRSEINWTFLMPVNTGDDKQAETKPLSQQQSHMHANKQPDTLVEEKITTPTMLLIAITLMSIHISLCWYQMFSADSGAWSCSTAWPPRVSWRRHVHQARQQSTLHAAVSQAFLCWNGIAPWFVVLHDCTPMMAGQ